MSATLVVFSEIFEDYCPRGKQKDGVWSLNVPVTRGAGRGGAVPAIAEGSAVPSGPGPLMREGGKGRAPPAGREGPRAAARARPVRREGGSASGPAA